MPSGPRLRIEKKGATAVLWIDNPPRNALRLSMISDLAARVPEIEKDDGIRALVVAGSGGLVFASGVDMEEWAKLAPKEAQGQVTRGQDAVWGELHLTKATVAAVTGVARGAGAELALACDIRIADETAIFSHPEARIGWMPSHGGTARLSKIVGRSMALELLVSGKELPGLDALRLAIVDHLTAPGEAIPQARALADAFAERPRSAVKAIKGPSRKATRNRTGIVSYSNLNTPSSSCGTRTTARPSRSCAGRASLGGFRLKDDQPLRSTLSRGPHRLSSRSTPTSVATKEPSRMPACFRIFRRCSSLSNERLVRKTPKSSSTAPSTCTAPVSRVPLARTDPINSIRRARTRLRYP